MAENIGIDALVKAAKMRLRKKSTDDLDNEVRDVVREAVEDMRRSGIDVQALLPDGADTSGMNPLAIRAVMLYVKANFGIAVSETERAQYAACYQDTVDGMSLCADYITAKGGV